MAMQIVERDDFVLYQLKEGFYFKSLLWDDGMEVTVSFQI